MSEIKLRQLAQMDPEYAEMLRPFFQSQGVTDYLDMTFDDFLTFSIARAEQWTKILAEGLQKHEHKV